MKAFFLSLSIRLKKPCLAFSSDLFWCSYNG